MEAGPPTPPPSPPTFVWVVVLMGVLVLAVQGILLFLVLDTRSGVTGLAEDLRDVELRLAGGGDPDTEAPVAAPPTTTAVPDTAPPDSAAPPTAPPDTADLIGLDELPTSPAPEFSTEAAGLPTLESNTGEDPAIGTTLGDLGAVEWEAGTEVVFDIDDGTSRAILVWAPGCAPCEELLPQLDQWHAGPGAELENVELVTVASAIGAGPEADLPTYLSEQSFSFPVLVDSGNELAARLGVSAFPFWVFVSPDGQVIGRVAGQLPPVQFASLFEDLETIAAEG